jgi:hypothetical protein
MAPFSLPCDGRKMGSPGYMRISAKRDRVTPVTVAAVFDRPAGETAEEGAPAASQAGRMLQGLVGSALTKPVEISAPAPFVSAADTRIKLRSPGLVCSHSPLIDGGKVNRRTLVAGTEAAHVS